MDSVFWQRAFSQRVWIVHEVASARICLVVIGKTVLPWNWLAEAAGVLIIYNYTVPTVMYSYNCDRIEQTRIHEQHDVAQSLLFLLARYQLFQSSDPRDKIYAIMGLSTSKSASLIIPNYNFPIAGVYERVTRMIMSEDRTLDVLCIRTPFPNDRFGLQS